MESNEMSGKQTEGYFGGGCFWFFFSIKPLPCPFCEGVNRFSMILKSMSLGLVCIEREIWILSHILLKNALWMLHIYSFCLLFPSALVLSLLGLSIWLQIHFPQNTKSCLEHIQDTTLEFKAICHFYEEFWLIFMGSLRDKWHATC